MSLIGARTIGHPGATVSRSSFYAPSQPSDHTDGSSFQPPQQGLVHRRAILQQVTSCDYFSQGTMMISNHLPCDLGPGGSQYAAKVCTSIPGGQCDPQVNQRPMIDLARIVYVCRADSPRLNARLRPIAMHRALTPGRWRFRYHIRITWTEDARK